MARTIGAQQVGDGVSEQLSKITELRMKTSDWPQREDRTAAAEYCEKLLGVDRQQILGTQMQIEIANQLYHLKRFPQAAAAYEKYVRNHQAGAEANNARLLLGIIYARDLHQFETAEKYLTQAREDFVDSKRQEQCDYWLGVIANAWGGSGAGA